MRCGAGRLSLPGRTVWPGRIRECGTPRRGVPTLPRTRECARRGRGEVFPVLSGGQSNPAGLVSENESGTQPGRRDLKGLTQPCGQPKSRRLPGPASASAQQTVWIAVERRLRVRRPERHGKGVAGSIGAEVRTCIQGTSRGPLGLTGLIAASVSGSRHLRISPCPSAKDRPQAPL